MRPASSSGRSRVRTSTGIDEPTVAARPSRSREPGDSWASRDSSTAYTFGTSAPGSRSLGQPARSVSTTNRGLPSVSACSRSSASSGNRFPACRAASAAVSAGASRSSSSSSAAVERPQSAEQLAQRMRVVGLGEPSRRGDEQRRPRPGTRRGSAGTAGSAGRRRAGRRRPATPGPGRRAGRGPPRRTAGPGSPPRPATGPPRRADRAAAERARPVPPGRDGRASARRPARAATRRPVRRPGRPRPRTTGRRR